ncbi:MAG: 3-isopropylmalate dehydratase small subunit [Anaerolineales bacterium]|jgi:3-isopropylmalate/(R)-2-methylmalate dehydratase small subunit
MQPFQKIVSHLIPIIRDNIDTDQIIPAQYLKVTDKLGLAEGCFASWRYRPDGALDPEFPINKPEYSSAQVILAGDNFGCGSSREHAAWALSGLGIKAVISTSFADIFRNNAIKNGILPVVVDQNTHTYLVNMVQKNPMSEVVVDLDHQLITLPNGETAEFPIDAFNKECMLEGIDSLEYLLKHQDRIQAYEEVHNV